MDKAETPKKTETVKEPIILLPHGAANGMVIMPSNPENYTQKDLKTLKITAAINVALLAGVIAATPYMKTEEAKQKEQDQLKPKTEYYQAPKAERDSVPVLDFAAAAKLHRNQTR